MCLHVLGLLDPRPRPRKQLNEAGTKTSHESKQSGNDDSVLKTAENETKGIVNDCAGKCLGQDVDQIAAGKESSHQECRSGEGISRPPGVAAGEESTGQRLNDGLANGTNRTPGSTAVGQSQTGLGS